MQGVNQTVPPREKMNLSKILMRKGRELIQRGQAQMQAMNDEYLAKGNEGDLYDDNDDDGFVVSNQDEENESLDGDKDEKHDDYDKEAAKN